MPCPAPPSRPNASLVRDHLDRRGPAPVPRRELVDQLVAGEVKVDRRHADLALAKRGDVGARLGIAGDSGTADPVVRLAVWVEPLDELVAIVALAEPRDLHSSDPLARKR